MLAVAAAIAVTFGGCGGTAEAPGATRIPVIRDEIAVARGRHVSVAAGAGLFVVAWEDGGIVRVARISRGGVVLDPGGIPLGGHALPAVAWDGTHFVTLWQSGAGFDQHYEGARIRPSGELAEAPHRIGSYEDYPGTCIRDGTCVLPAPGGVCRASRGPCDPAETCGAGGCPADTFAADGSPCPGGMCDSGACVPLVPALPDAGAADAGVLLDAGTATDAATAFDGALRGDAGPVDTGLASVDTGIRLLPRRDDDGCTVSSRGGRHSSWLVVLGALFAVVMRRRA